MKENVLITGGTGFVGRYLTKLLINRGYHVFILSRKKQVSTEDITYFKWDTRKNRIEKEAVLKADYILHLAGENVAQKRWSIRRKAAILNSRVLTTELLFKTLSKNEHSVKAFISASAIGYYGTITSEAIFKETTEPGNDFLSEVCKRWECAVGKIETLGIRTVKLRTGVVFGKEGSALQKIVAPINLGLGAAIATGKQNVPWIHLHDLCEMYLFGVAQPQISGVFNAVVNEPVNNKQLSKEIALKLKKPFFMPRIPKIFLQMIFGEMAVILTEGSRVSSQKIIEAGFVFKYPTLQKALGNLLEA